MLARMLARMLAAREARPRRGRSVPHVFGVCLETESARRSQVNGTPRHKGTHSSFRRTPRRLSSRARTFARCTRTSLRYARMIVSMPPNLRTMRPNTR